MKLLISALEPSSNFHLKELIKYLNNIEFVGIYDKNLISTPPLYDMREFSVMGFVDIISKYFKAKEAIKELAFISRDCNKVILIDAPAFNITLAKEIKKVNPNIEIIYYILPKVWVWKENRIKKVEKYCDKLISIFPFEKNYFKNSLYLGNPLLDEIDKFKLRVSNNNTITFLAGSRKSEIEALMPIFREVAKKIDKKRLLVIPEFLEDLSIYGDISDFEVIRDTKEALIQSDFAFICSGTATLEASLIGTPFVLVYRAKAIDFLIAKFFIKIKFVGLANIIFNFESLGKFHIELLQDDVNLQNILEVYGRCDREQFLINSKKLREILKGGVSKELAKVIRNN